MQYLVRCFIIICTYASFSIYTASYLRFLRSLDASCRMYFLNFPAQRIAFFFVHLIFHTKFRMDRARKLFVLQYDIILCMFYAVRYYNINIMNGFHDRFLHAKNLCCRFVRLLVLTPVRIVGLSHCVLFVRNPHCGDSWALLCPPPSTTSTAVAGQAAGRGAPPLAW